MSFVRRQSRGTLASLRPARSGLGSHREKVRRLFRIHEGSELTYVTSFQFGVLWACGVVRFMVIGSPLGFRGEFELIGPRPAPAVGGDFALNDPLVI